VALQLKKRERGGGGENGLLKRNHVYTKKNIKRCDRLMRERKDM